ncbi:MAG: OmpP1/FadL family transporter [Desulfatiglandales bacterium]
MGKRFFLLTALVVVLLGHSVLYAGGIENKSNLSAEWIRTLNRNGATDSADCAAYNPAGAVKMGEGLYVNIAGQYAFKTYSNAYRGVTYEDEEPNIIPSVFGLYRKGPWGVFGAFTIPSGGGRAEYGQGSVSTLRLAQFTMARSGGVFDRVTEHYIEGNSCHYGFTLGGAYAMNDLVSLSIALRYVDARRERKGFATLAGPFLNRRFHVDYEETGDGLGGIVGLNISPSESLNIGMRFETETNLDLKTTVHRDDLGVLREGERVRRDLPGVIGVGVSYQFTPALRAEADWTSYLNAHATWDDLALSAGDETQKKNGYELGIMAEYAFSPRVRASAGYLFSKTGIDPDDMSIEQPELDAHTLAAGLACEARPGLILNLGAMRSFYDAETTSGGVKLEKDVWILAIGLQYKFF